MMEWKPAPALDLEGVTKRFGGVTALEGASLRVERGTIHGLVGQNGAGKSTLIKLLAGIHRPDGGSIAIDGAAADALTPSRAEALGVHFIHQDRLLVPSFTVGEALFLGHEPRLAGTPFLDRRAMARRAEATLRDYFGLSLPKDALVASLTTAERQIVQIARALLRRPSILVFDEPTASLVRREAEILFALIRRLRADGVTILYISHYLGEIEALCDRVTVMRNGRDVATVDPREVPARRIAELMIARDVGEMFPKRQVPIGEVALAARGLHRQGRFRDVSLEVRRGEIVGLTGLVGSGAKDLVRVLFGLDVADGGEVEVLGTVGRAASPAAAVARSVALVPEDRRKHGIALALSVAENVTLAGLRRFSRFGFLSRVRERGEVDALIGRLAIKTNGRDAAVQTLSGGNQQKVAIAKWLSRRSDVYILDEPTVGVDVGSKVEIYQLIGDLAARGAGVLILSSDLAELAGIADRILVMVRGRIVQVVAAGDASEESLLAIATGSEEESRHVG